MTKLSTHRDRVAALGCCVLLLATSCGESASPLQVDLLLPRAPDPLADATQVELTIGGPGAEPVRVTADVTSGAVSLPQAPFGKDRVLEIVARNASGTVVARGRTGPFDLGADEPTELTLPLARVEVFSLLPHSLSQARHDHVAVLLPDGRVLVAGGRTDALALDSVEIFDPTDWSLTTGPAPLARARARLGAVRIDDLVVFAGGEGDGGALVDGAEIYDINSGAVRQVTLAGRVGHTVSALPDGTVLIAGGRDANGPTKRVEIIDPRAATVRITDELEPERSLHIAASLPSGAVLVAGGTKDDPGFDPVPDASVYEPDTGRWREVTKLPVPLALAAATPLADGSVLVVGGDTIEIEFDDGEFERERRGVSSAFIYQADSERWITVNGGRNRTEHAAAPLADGALVAGAGGGRIDFVNDAGFTERDRWLVDRRRMTLTALADGAIISIGGHEGNRSLADVLLYLPR